MKITLTPSQAIALRQAPNDWAALPGHISTAALRLHGLVVIRDAPGARTLNRGFQWKVTLSGMRLEGRKLQPKPEPEVAPKEINLQPNGTKRKYTKRGSEEIIGVRPVLRRRPQFAHRP